jgi:LAGLIDADG DNA endonuclease family protein
MEIMKLLTEFEKGWLAAAIDGEGTIVVDISRTQIFITNTNYEFIAYAMQLLGENSKIYKHQPTTPRKLVMRAVLNIQWDIRDLLIQIEPYLLIKRDLAKKAIAFCDGCHERKARRHEGNGQAKLTESEVSQIKGMYTTGRFTLAYLGDLYGVSTAQISNITRGKQWASVKSI